MNVLSAGQEEVRELCKAGRWRQAYEIAQRIGPLRTWQGTLARLLAADLAAELGGRRLADALRLRAVRADSRSAEARCAAVGVLLGRQGPLPAWTGMVRWGGPAGMDPPALQARWLALQARIWGAFRDFDNAARALRRAERLAPGEASTSLARVWLLEEQDQCEEALRLARRMTGAVPSYRPAVMAVAHLLLALGRADEAGAVLSNAVAQFESGAIVAALASVLAGQRRFAETLDCLERFEALSPLLGRDGRRWLAALRSDAFYELGDLEGARKQATLAGDPFHAALAERLASPAEDTHRVLLGVPFVRQHHRTCTPASLASVARFWCRPVDHAALAETICYDGTPRHRARAWAEANGWIVGEFRVTWASACALLDRGIPFVLAIAGPMSGHDQAVVGYDARRGSFYVREPSNPFLGEVLAAPFLASQRWSGPRGFVLVPRGEDGRLARVDLPDAEAYDHLHCIQTSLEKHRRDDAEAVRREMERVFPDHPLTLWAAALTAGYDSDDAGQVQSLEGLLCRFPDSAALLFRKISLLEGVAPPGELRRLLEESCKRHPRDLPLLSRLAHELSRDARDHARATRALRITLRTGSSATMGRDLLTLAQIEQVRGHADEALQLHRLAACLEDMNEALACLYFTAAHARERDDEALALLRRRVEKLASRSGYPAATLSWALEQSGYVPQALDALKRGLALRPADGDLMLLAADAYARHGHLERADALLRQAYGRVRLEAWLRTAARTSFARLRRREEEARPPARPGPAPRATERGPAWLGPLLFVALMQLLSSRQCDLEGVPGPDWTHRFLAAALCALAIAGVVSARVLWRQRRVLLQLGLEAPKPREGGPPPAPKASASRFGRYYVDGVLADGGGVAIHHARDPAWGCEVALKVALDPSASARLRREAEVAGRLHHDHIEAVHEVGELDGRPYVACELLKRGLPLAQLRRARVGLHAAVAITAQLLEGLRHAHEQGVVHLAVNPDNVFIGFDGCVKILGFGLVGDAPRAGGAVDYLSPEQVHGLEVDTRSDLYSVGVVLRELLSGARIVHAGAWTTPTRETRDGGSGWAGFPHGAQWGRLRALLARALQAEPADRYPDARAVSAALLEVLEVGEDAPHPC